MDAEGIRFTETSLPKHVAVLEWTHHLGSVMTHSRRSLGTRSIAHVNDRISSNLSNSLLDEI